MAVTTPSSINVTQLSIDTQQYIDDTLVDQVYDRIPFIYKLYRNKRVVISGGDRIELRLNYGKNTQTQVYTSTDTMNSDTESKRTLAYIEWTLAQTPIKYTVDDLIRNRSPQRVLDTVAAESDAAQMSLKDQISQMFFGVYGALDSTTMSARPANYPWSMPSILWYNTAGESDSTTYDYGSDTYAGITRSTNTDWWLGISGTASSAYPDTAVDVSFDTWDYIVDSCMKHGAQRNNLLAVCGSTLFRKWKALVRTESQGPIQTGEMMDAGFPSFKVDGISEIVLDDNCPDNYFYMLDLDSWTWYVNSHRNFQVTPFVWQGQHNNGTDEYLARILLAHNLTCNKPRNNYFTAAMA